MIKPEQVPESAWQQASGLWFNGATWPQIIAAALNAWPGMQTGSDDGGMTLSGIYIPITETPDDKV